MGEQCWIIHNGPESIVWNVKSFEKSLMWNPDVKSFDELWKEEDYIITDKGLMKELNNIFVNGTDIGLSDHYILWFELGSNFDKSRKKQGKFCINGE